MLISAPLRHFTADNGGLMRMREAEHHHLPGEPLRLRQLIGRACSRQR